MTQKQAATTPLTRKGWSHIVVRKLRHAYRLNDPSDVRPYRATVRQPARRNRGWRLSVRKRTCSCDRPRAIGINLASE
jgi:hypothetical protein